MSREQSEPRSPNFHLTKIDLAEHHHLMRFPTLVALVLCYAVPIAEAADLVNGRTARFRNPDGDTRDSAVVRFDREPEIVAPLPNPLCPETSTVTIVTDRHTIGPIELNCALWEEKRYGFLYRDRDGTAGGVEKVQIRDGRNGGKLFLRIDGPSYGASPIDGPVSFVEVSVELGATAYCGRFEPPTATIQTNKPDSVRLKGPSLPCGAVPSPTTTPSIVEECRPAGFCVTVPPGDDQWNQLGSAADVQGTCDDDYVATTSLASDGASTEYLDCTNFSFAVPDGSEILGITTQWTRGKSNVDRPLIDLESRVIRDNQRVGANRASGADWCRNCLDTESYGGPSDLWNEAWSPADIRSSGFGASLRGQRLAGGSGVLNGAADCVRICVQYASGPTPTPTATGTTTPTPSATATGGATSTPTPVPTGALVRPADPVVMTGAQLPLLTGTAPNLVVGFRYTSAWQQIPVQIDERDVISFDDVYDGNTGYGGGFTRLDYTDAGTFAGADADPDFDNNDELVFMARDAGDLAGSAIEPIGVVPGSGVQVQIVDPLGGVGYVYLFRHDGSLSPDAGDSYVDYAFVLQSGTYLSTYHIGAGPNPETSVIDTDHYSVRFADRWIRDETRIHAGSANGVDILDRHKALFGPSLCLRSEDSFSNGEGAFIVNKSGPVRAIRSYVGANSGPRTQRQHHFYDRREDVLTFLRVHNIPGIVDFFDYSPDAAGMVYRNSNNLAGVVIDGVPESPADDLFTWESITGPQGSITHVAIEDTDVTLSNVGLYYLDDVAPADTQCTGDSFAYGSSGLRVSQGIPNTDPAVTPTAKFEATRVIFFDAPGLDVAGATLRSDWARNPLLANASPW